MATQFSGPIAVHPSDMTENSSVQQEVLGALAATNDGRMFRYAKAGAVALVVGTLQQAQAEQTTAQNLAVAAAAIGDSSVVTTTTLTVTANQYAGGWVIVTTSAGVGYQYKIKSHPAVTTAALTLTLDDPLRVALTTSSRIDLVANPFSVVVINPSTATSAPCGVAVTPITINYFGWLQTGGPAVVLADGTVVVGTSVVASNATAGAVEAGTGVQALVGTALTGIATTEYGGIDLNLN